MFSDFFAAFHVNGPILLYLLVCAALVIRIRIELLDYASVYIPHSHC